MTLSVLTIRPALKISAWTLALLMIHVGKMLNAKPWATGQFADVPVDGLEILIENAFNVGLD